MKQHIDSLRWLPYYIWSGAHGVHQSEPFLADCAVILLLVHGQTSPWAGAAACEITIIPMTNAPKHPGGRPSKYSKAYCNEIIEHMRSGASIASFAAEIGVARSTVNEWADNHDEFSEALKVAKAKCAAWWEERLRNIAMTGGAPGAATAVIFGLKNMASEEWRDKVIAEHTGKDGGPIQTQDVSAVDVIEAKLMAIKERRGAAGSDAETVH